MHVYPSRFIIITLLFFCWNFSSNASPKTPEDTVMLTQSANNYAVSPHIGFLQDYNQHFTFDEIRKNSVTPLFRYYDKKKPGFGKGNFTLWARLVVKAKDSVSMPWYIEIAYPNFDSLTFYHQDSSGEWHDLLVGDHQDFYKRPFNHRDFIFQLPLHKGETQVFYFKVRSSGAIIFPAEIHTLPALYNRDTREEVLFGIFYGIMLVMMLYNIFLAYSTRAINYLYYALIILGNILTLSALNGHAFQYLWPHSPWWANHVIPFGIGVWITFSNLFAHNLLEAKSHSKPIHHYYRWMTYLGIAEIIASLILSYRVAMYGGNLLLAINCLGLFVTGIIFWYLKAPLAKLFTIAWTLYLAGVIMYNFRDLGYLPVNFVTTYILEIGAIIEVILLSLAIGYKYRGLLLEKRQAQQKAITAMSENQRIVQNQNELLENKIRQHTRSLRRQQEEILYQNEELAAKNEKLTKARETIEKQNAQLKHYNDNLEKEVTRQTRELRVSNQELAYNVQKLEQYAYITAHNLRAPVARMLGLIHLMEIKPKDDNTQENEMIAQLIKEAGEELDTVIKDMNSIIELRDTADQQEVVELENKLSHVLSILKTSIEDFEADIQYDFSKLPSFKTNGVFLESIFYNLISNAIKYRSLERKPMIRISSKSTPQYYKISVSDNGLGIDLKKQKRQLFTMYQRFHTHTEGKGLGLFLVKSQIEMMGGKIRIESVVDEGTTFHVFFPKNAPADKSA